MTSWAKNQIAKQLARFVKNLDPSQISLKFLKGEGELTNLELNEEVLTDLLELPPWLQLRKAICNRICAKIHWTSLKTDPIQLFLDCVEVEIFASETVNAKPQHNVPPYAKHSSKDKPQPVKASKYGFAEKVVDGMYVSINSVLVSFKASGFRASFSMSRFIVQSTDPGWNVTNNLRKTRIKDEQRGQVLIFKQIKWGTMRIDADAAYAEVSEQASIPIRLITNNSAIHLTIKKRLADCSLVSSRLEMIFDDILWILTQSQLLKISSFVHFLLKVRQRHLPMATHTEAQKYHKQPSHVGDAAAVVQHGRRASPYQGTGHGSNLNKYFTEHDVLETSYHLTTNRIDLHLCDDQTLSGDAVSYSSSRSADSSDSPGALLISIQKFRLDHYPYHIANLKRKLAKGNDDDALFSRRQWAQQLFDFFLKNEGKDISHYAHQQSKSLAPSRRPLMYESFFLISCTHFAIMQVSTSSHQESKPFLASDKEGLFLPEDMNSFLLDFTSYYFIGYNTLPVPPSNMFLKMNPVKLVFHPLTCIWLNKFIQSVIAGLEWTKEFLAKDCAPPEHLDIRIECLMPQVTVPCNASEELPHSNERPKALLIQISQAVISNSRIGTATSQSDLLMDVQDALASDVYSRSNGFPNMQSDCGPLPNEYWVNDYSMLHRRFCQPYHRNQREEEAHLHFTLRQETGDANTENSNKSSFAYQSTDGSKKSASFTKGITNPRVIWCVWCEQIWVDFVGIKKSCGRPVTFIDAVPIRLWLSFPVVLPSEPLYLKEDVGSMAALPKDRFQGETNQPSTGAIILQKPSRANVPKTGSCTSLPATLKSQQAFLSNSSSCSSVSIDSVSSTVNEKDPAQKEVYGVPGQGRTLVSMCQHASSLGSTEEPPLRTSYSETDLMLNQAETEPMGSYSSREFSSVKDDLRLEASSPPPPYSAYSGVLTDNCKANSNEALPPVYSQLPNYDSAGTDAVASPGTSTEELASFFNCHQEAQDSDKCNSNRIPTIGCILHVTKATSIQLDHFQLLFLLRVQEMMQEVATKITGENLLPQPVKSPLSQNAALEGQFFSMHISIPSLDLNIVLPPSIGVQSEQYLCLEDRMKSGKLTRFFELIQKTRQNANKKHENIDHGYFMPSDAGKSQRLAERDNCAPGEEQSSSTLADKLMPGGVEGPAGKLQINSCSTGLVNAADGCEWNGSSVTGAVAESQPKKVVIAIEEKSECKEDIATGDRDSLFDVPVNPEDHVFITDDSPDERGSDDGQAKEDETRNFLFLEACETEFQRSACQQDVLRSDASTQTDAIACTNDDYEFFKNEGVSVIRSKCKNLRIAVQSRNSDSVVKVSVGKINLKEDGDVTYGMTLDHRLSSAKPDEKEELHFLNSKPQLRVRLISGPAAEQYADGAAQLGFAHIKVCNLDANLLLSNTESLSEFVEDEYFLKKMPFKIELENIEVKLFDDKPRRYTSALLPPPIELWISSLILFGSASGQIFIGDDIRDGYQEGALLKADVKGGRKGDPYEENLLRNSGDGDSGISNIETAREQNAMVIEENERLIDDLKLANARMVSLEQERDAILKVVEKLQQELMWSNHENDQLAEKVKSYKMYLKDLGNR